MILKNNLKKVIDIDEVIQAKRIRSESFEEVLIVTGANLLPLISQPV